MSMAESLKKREECVLGLAHYNSQAGHGRALLQRLPDGLFQQTVRLPAEIPVVVAAGQQDTEPTIAELCRFPR